MLRRTWYGNADMMITTTTKAKNWFSIEKHRIQILWKIEIKQQQQQQPQHWKMNANKLLKACWNWNWLENKIGLSA